MPFVSSRLLRQRLSGAWCFLIASLFVGVFAGSETYAQQDLIGSTGVRVNTGGGGGAAQPRKRKPRPRPTPNNTVNNSGGGGRRPVTPVVPSRNIEAQVDQAIARGDAARSANPPRYAEAAQEYNKALRLDTTEARAYSGLGNVYFNQNRYAEAQASFTKAVSYDADDQLSQTLLAFSHNNLGQWANGERAARAALRTKLEAGETDYKGYAFAALGWSLYKQGKMQQGAQYYQQAIGELPQNAGLYSDLTQILLDMRNYEDAEAEIARAAQLNGNDVSIRHIYGVVLQKQGKLAAALEQYRRAISINAASGAPHSNSALIYYMQGNFQQARNEWQAGVRLGSNYPPDRIGLMILEGRFAEALPLLEQYTQQAPGDEDGWMLLGDVRGALNNNSGAQQAYSQGAEIALAYARLPRPNLRGGSAGSGSNSSNNNGGGSGGGSGGDTNRPGANGYTPLIEAVRGGQASNVRNVLSRGASVDGRDKDGWTALFFAAGVGNTEIMQALINANADVNARAKDGLTAMHTAAGFNRTNAMNMLLANGADINGRTTSSVTPLMLAAYNGHVDAVRFLIGRGVDLNIKNEDNQTALEIAVSRNHSEVARVLRDAGAR